MPAKAEPIRYSAHTICDNTVDGVIDVTDVPTGEIWYLEEIYVIKTNDAGTDLASDSGYEVAFTVTDSMAPNDAQSASKGFTYNVFSLGLDQTATTGTFWDTSGNSGSTFSIGMYLQPGQSIRVHEISDGGGGSGEFDVVANIRRVL